MQYNFTDPESRIMKGADGFVQAYNAQVAVEPEFQLIVGQKITQACNDKQQMKPLVELIEEQAGQKPAEAVSDSGCLLDGCIFLRGDDATGELQGYEAVTPAKREA